ncbi:DNA-binding protein [Labedella phragmitis]|uniref:DNA-binding protein n=2 Tax=Labedella TaxID=390250 RepID=A0A444Q2G1_9MICO|nr:MULTISPECIES: DNA-binding protein [Labedella]RWZ46453.1 DNA-binding protein [Labedella phragmitis]RWZ55442.1 DNA-binding protein [Labedella populi]
MFVITADQVDSRSTDDAAAGALRDIGAEFGDRLRLPPDRTAGDEIQALTGSADTAYRLVLRLTRDGRWSVGLGVGTIREPLGDSTRASTGNAFFAARTAIDAAKRTPARFALRAEPPTDESRDRSTNTALGADGIEALIALVLALREKRTDKGWEVHDLLDAGSTQSEAARTLGITQGAVSMRARTGSSREEFAASEAIVRLLENLHTTTTDG